MNVTTPPAAYDIYSVEHIESFDGEFQRWLQDNPGGSFSIFSAQQTSAMLKKGAKHHTLGTRLFGPPWAKAGHPFYEKLLDLSNPPKYARVCDYGCGSLRTGVHFIRRQYADCYFGLDVTRDYIEDGIKLAGDLTKRRRALFGTIRNDLDRAIKFDADMLFTANVVCHVHPDEVEDFYSNIKRIVHRPNGIVLLHVIENPSPIRYQKSGWAWPLEFYDEKMQPFNRVETQFLRTVTKGSHTVSGYLLAYKRPATSITLKENIAYAIKDKIREYQRWKKRWLRTVR